MPRPPGQAPLQADHKRIPALQVLRAVAAILVAQTHVVAVAGAHRAKAAQVTAGSFAYLGACGVDIFFVISGFIVPLTASRSTGTRLEFLRKRALRIYPLWWYLLGIMALTKLVRGMDGKAAFDLFWSALLLPKFDPSWQPAIFMGWSLIFEVFFYLMIGLLWKPRLSTVLIICASLGIAGTWGTHIPLAHLLTNPLLLEFSLGTLLAILWSNEVRIPRALAWTALLTGVGALFWTGVTGCQDISQIENIVTGALAAKRTMLWGIPSFLMVGGAVYLRPEGNKWMLQVGDASYSLYMTSYYGQYAVHALWPLLAWLPGDLAIATGTALLVAIGMFVYRVIEAPLLRALQTKRPGA